MKTTQIKKIFFLLSLSIFVTASAFSQQHFIPLKEGDYTVEDKESKVFSNIKASGSYRAFWGTHNDSIFPQKGKSSKTGQDIRLKLRSQVNTDASLNVTFRNGSADLKKQKNGYNYRDDPDDTGSSNNDTGMNVILDEGYLEYNHNPNAKLKIGRHFINVADRRGFIYQGTAAAISQECRIGTWCYYIGGAKLEDGVDDSLYWVQLDYPVYQSGTLKRDLWSKKMRQNRSFNVEMFKVLYHGHDIPLARYGGITGENSNYQAKTEPVKKNIFFDNHGTEYIGVNVDWNHDDLDLHLVITYLAGSRQFHTGTQNRGNVENMQKKSIQGRLYYSNLNYQFLPEWRFELAALYGSGTRFEDKETKIWQQDSTSFLEIQKGDHEAALIYFNGKDALGDGHSVTNLRYEKLGFSYRSLLQELSFDLHYYQFRHAVPVYTQAGIEERIVGQELDTKVGLNLKENLSFDLFWGAFLPKNGYSRNNNSPPIPLDKTLSLFGAEFKYIF